jgi:hypothetical protein
MIEDDPICDVFIKLGGSILDDHSATAELTAHLTTLAQRHRILILPGGGHVVKRIKTVHQEHGSDFLGCWRAAVLCVDVNAGILSAYSKSFTVVSSAADMVGCFAAGNIGVFAPAAVILSSLDLLPAWQPTTDSMGLYFASILGARRYVIVSDVNGVYDKKPAVGTNLPPISRMTLDELERLPSSKLDPSFPAYFRRYALPTMIVNGRHPDRVCAAIRDESTMGTQIELSQGEGLRA